MVAGTVVRSTLMTSSSPSPSPVRLSPWCTMAPSGELVLLKNTKYSSERILWLSARPNALASRSKSVPVVERTSQPRPTDTALRPGASLVSETLPPLERLTPIAVPFTINRSAPLSDPGLLPDKYCPNGPADFDGPSVRDTGKPYRDLNRHL